MDYGGESGKVVESGGDYWGQGVWATEDEYGVWDRETASDEGGRQSQTRSGSEPPNNNNKKRNNNGGGSLGQSKAIGKMFFKTKLCCKFRAGTCPYVTNCNFAHSIEELRRPPPNWQDIVAAHANSNTNNNEEDSIETPREEFQIPSIGLAVDSQRSYKGRHCKKFYTDEGCPYGDTCTFLHDEQSKARESVVISLGPGYGATAAGINSGGGGGINNSGGGASAATTTAAASAAAEAANNPMLKPSNWKTRICNKWEQTGYCPFGSKCHFAHGAAELHRYGGGLVDVIIDAPPTSPNKQPQALPLKTPPPTPIEQTVDVYHHHHHNHNHHHHHVGRLPGVIPRTGQRPFQKWKGPDKISRIYGDWIDDIE